MMKQLRPACSFVPALHPDHEAIRAECEPWILAFASPASEAASHFWRACAFPLFCSLVYPHCPTHRLIPLVKLFTWFFVSDTDDDDPSVRGCQTDHITLRHQLILSCYAGRSPLQHMTTIPPPAHDQHPLPSPAGSNGNILGAAILSKIAKESESSRLEAAGAPHAYADGNHVTKGLLALHEIWRDISPHLPLKAHHRFLDAMRDHLNANRLQAHYRSAGRLPGVDEYLHALRRPTSLVLPCLILIEFALGIELDDETVGNETMVRLLDAVTDHVALANDVLSWEAEKSYGDDFNLPRVIFRDRAAAHPDFTLAEAVLEALSVVEKVDMHCLQLITEVESSGLIEKPGVRAYLRGLESWMAGNIEWSLKTARYSHTCSAEGLVCAVAAGSKNT